MVAEKYLELRSQLGTTLGSLIALAHQIGAPEDTLRNLQNLVTNLGQPFLFVVVGEVKAGKSSLLNALFGRDFCKVDVLPATDRIYEFKYGEKDYDVQISDHITALHRRIDFLKDFNIVDTPGTNTIVANHQEITENFVPMADLIVFVFAVTNPWAASAWDFLRLIGQQWKKNIVFVVQQADLRDPHEVEIVSKHLDQTVLQILGASCPIFAVSAKKAFLAKTSPNVDRDKLWSESHFGELEDWITETVSRERRTRRKIAFGRANGASSGGRLASTSARFVGYAEIGSGETSVDPEHLRRAKSANPTAGWRIYPGDRTSVRRLPGTGRKGAWRNDLPSDRPSRWFSLVPDGRKISRTKSNPRSKKKSRARSSMRLSLLESDLRSMWQDLQDKVNVQFGSETKKQVRAVMPGFLTQRQEVLQRLQLTLLEQMSDAKIKEQLQSLFGETARWLRVPTSVAAAGGIATVIAALTHTALLDVTGTVAGLAALTGTLYAVWRRRKILRQYREQMNEKRRDLTRAVESQLNHAIEAFYHEVGLTFSPLESFCDSESKRHAPLREQIESLDQAIGAIKSQLG